MDKGFKRISIPSPIKDRFRKLRPGKEPTPAGYGSDWRAELQDIGNRGGKGEFVEEANARVEHGAYWVDLALSSVDPKHDDVVVAGTSADGCTIYVNTFPCFQCARRIVNAGIKKVVYVEAYPIEEAVEFLNTDGVEIKPFEGFTPRIFNQVFRQVE